MDITGKLINILETKRGTSKSTGKPWAANQFVIDTDDQYNNLYCFDLFGEEKINDFLNKHKIGDKLTVQFNINTNEWEGKYFTKLSAWKIEGERNSQPAPAFDNLAEGPEEGDDLPF